MKVLSGSVYPASFNNPYKSKYHQYSNPAFNGYTYKPTGRGFWGNLNPLIRYADDVFSRSLNASRRNHTHPRIELQPFTEEIYLKNSYAWDINPNNRKKYIIIMHGFSQNITHLQDLYKEIIENTPYAVLAPEYRGFGKNEPVNISSDELLEDTKNVLEYLESTRGIEHKDITLLGHSFGGCVASYLASKVPDLERLILVSSLLTLDKNSLAVKKAFKNRISKFIKFLYNHMNFLMYPITSSINTAKFLKKTDIPVDIIYSKFDKMIKQTVPPQLIKACKNLKETHIMQTGGHRMDSHKITIIVSILNQ